MTTRYLRCESQGKTFAIIDDLENEYRYCINPGEGKNLTVSRIEKTVERFLLNSVEPDHVRSEALPKSDYGPVKVVVADNLRQFTEDPTRDVLLHFYAEFDDQVENISLHSISKQTL